MRTQLKLSIFIYLLCCFLCVFQATASSLQEGTWSGKYKTFGSESRTLEAEYEISWLEASDSGDAPTLKIKMYVKYDNEFDRINPIQLGSPSLSEDTLNFVMENKACQLTRTEDEAFLGECKKGADMLSKIKMVPPAIALVVTVQVMDENNHKPVEGAQVTLTHENTAVYDGTTSAIGEAVFTELPKGKISIVVDNGNKTELVQYELLEENEVVAVLVSD